MTVLMANGDPAPGQDADGTISLKELGRHVAALGAIHRAAMASDDDVALVDFGEIRKRAIALLQMVGTGEETTGDSRRHRAPIVHDAHRRASGGVPAGAGASFPGLGRFGTAAPGADHTARAAPASIVGGNVVGVSAFPALERFR